MPIGQEKIFRTPLEEYLTVNKKSFTDYNQVAVHSLNQHMAVSSEGGRIHWSDVGDNLSILELFCERVPDKAEVVVGYEIKFDGAGSGSNSSHYQSFLIYQYGIALIPKHTD